ncbi:hypothetical protein RNJ44_01873 [Nakaseomyces bracarensis]|uniref:Uncharacterized protein n=1 Tax=Nakaseomyces bracarensis TaxID=273131 RepID=A0ABR4NP06_9SACH
MRGGSLRFIVRILLERHSSGPFNVLGKRVITTILVSVLVLVRRLRALGGFDKVYLKRWGINTVAVLSAINLSPFLKSLLNNRRYESLVDRAALILSISIANDIPERLVSLTLSNAVVNHIIHFLNSKRLDSASISILNHLATSGLITLTYLLGDKESRLYKSIIFKDQFLFFDFITIYGLFSVNSLYSHFRNKLVTPSNDKDLLAKLSASRDTYKRYRRNQYSEISNNSKIIIDKLREKYELSFKKNSTKLELLLRSSIFQNLVKTSQWCIFRVLLIHIFKSTYGKFRLNVTTQKFLLTFFSLLTLDFGKVMYVHPKLLKLLTYYVSMKYYHDLDLSQQLHKIILSIGSCLLI